MVEEEILYLRLEGVDVVQAFIKFYWREFGCGRQLGIRIPLCVVGQIKNLRSKDETWSHFFSMDPSDFACEHIGQPFIAE
jgi:hypothetical protein